MQPLSQSCHICNLSISKVSSDLSNTHMLDRLGFVNLFDSNIHYMLCRKCRKTETLYSKTKCKQDYLFTESDFDDLKWLHSKTNIKLYLLEDIEKIIVDKYGTITKLNDTLKETFDARYERKERLIKKKNIKATKRHNELKKVLDDFKIELCGYGDHYSYIHYGTPSIVTIIENETSKVELALNKKIQLAKELEKHKILFCNVEQLRPCTDFVNGFLSLSETVHKIKNRNSIVLSFN